MQVHASALPSLCTACMPCPSHSLPGPGCVLGRWRGGQTRAPCTHLPSPADKGFASKFRVAADAEAVIPVPELAPGLQSEEIYTPVPPFTSSKGGKGGKDGKGGTAASATKPEAEGQAQSASRSHWWRPLNP